jgi:hypothetical protein
MRMRISVCTWLTVALLGATVTESGQDDPRVPVSPSRVVNLGGDFFKTTGLVKVFPGVGLVSPVAKNAAELYEAYDFLSKDDEAYDPNYRPPGMPQLPAHCAAARDFPTRETSAESAECARCFEPAYENLNRLRYRFEKIRRIYVSTKNFNKRLIALGDSIAGSIPFAGLAWMKKRIEIEQSMKDFDGTYDSKYKELIGELEDVLKAIAECEEKVYGEKAWYERFGFIYHQFMADRYLRSD